MLLTPQDFAQMFKDVIENSAEKVPHYFAPEASINLNGKELSFDDLIKRSQWMTRRTLKVHFEEALITKERAACVHYSSISENGHTSVFKVFSRMSLKEGKITRFEHMTLKISGEAPDTVVNDF